MTFHKVAFWTRNRERRRYLSHKWDHKRRSLVVPTATGLKTKGEMMTNTKENRATVLSDRGDASTGSTDGAGLLGDPCRLWNRSPGISTGATAAPLDCSATAATGTVCRGSRPAPLNAG